MSGSPIPEAAIGSDHGGDDDSLFGSPPSSPTRGRSPSPLALPGGSGSAQNVGTLALPGSHLVAELPNNPPASLPLSASAPAPSQPSVPRTQVATTAPQSRAPQPRSSSSRRSTPGPSRPLCSEPTSRKTRKGKERQKSATPRPTPPPIPLPSPDEPPPPNFLRNQQALLGLAGMVGGVNPANLSKARHTRGATAENPIVVEDEPQAQQYPSIGKRPTHPLPSDPSHLPRPTSEQILGTLLKQKNIFPVVVSLLRLLAPGSPSLATVPPGYPHYPYYPYPYVHPMPAPHLHTQWQSQAPAPAVHSHSSSSSGAPPAKRRKLSSVPAGAAEWDVPYPFQEGQGPENYRSAWEQERGKQLLKDLVQLVQNAARKAATKAWYQQQVQQKHPVPSVLKYYRPATLYYGLEHGQSTPSSSSQTTSQGHSSRTQSPGSGTPVHDEGDGLLRAATAPAPPLSHPRPASGEDGSHHPPNPFDQLVESLLAAQKQHQPPSGPAPSGDQSSTMPTDPPPPPAPTSSGSSEDNQAFFDHWLEILTTFPPGDPNDASVGTAAPAATSATANPSGSSSSSHMGPTSDPSQISDDLIDPALLDMQVDLPIASLPGPSSGTAGEQSHAASNSTGTFDSRADAAESSIISSVAGKASSATSPTNVQPATPSLVASPSVTVTSLADTAERDGDAGPPTPSWDWMFAETQETQEGAKILDQLAGMDVDVDLDAMMNLDGWENAFTTPVDGQPPPAPEPESVGVQPGPGVPTDEQGPRVKETAVLDGSSTPQPFCVDPHASPPCLSSSQAPAIIPPAPCAPQDENAAQCASAAVLPQAPATLPAPASTSAAPTVAHPPVATRTTARAKGKAKAIPGTGNGVGLGTASGKQDRRAILEKARAMRAALAKEVERTKVALWETTLEQGVLVSLGKELEKGA